MGLEPLTGLLLILAIGAYPLDPYRVAAIGLSLYRVFALSFVGLTGLAVLWHRQVRGNGPILILGALLVYISVHYFVTAPHSGWAVSKFNAYAFGMVLAVAVAQTPYHTRRVLIGIQVAFWMTVPFVIYSLYTFLVRQTLVTGLPPLPGFDVGSGGWLAEGHSFEGMIRLAAPFPAPQFLGLLAAAAAFICVWKILREPRTGLVLWLRYATLGAAVFVTLGSLSRSAILPGLAWIGALVLARVRYRGAALRFAVPAILAVAIIVGVGTELQIGNVGEIALERATSAPASFGRHLETRLAALSMWAESPRTMVLGTAFGEYGQLWAADGPHSHSPYTTLLPEVGLVGVGLLVLFLASLLRRTLATKGPARITFWLVSMVSFALLLYEFLALQFVWALLGAGAAAATGDSVRSSADRAASASLPGQPEPG